MTMLEGLRGPVVGADQTSGPFRLGKESALVVDSLHGRYAELARRGLLWTATNQAAQAVSVALAATYTGLCLSNPEGSGKLLEVLGAGYALSVAPAAIASIHLIGGYSAAGVTAHTAAVTPQNALIGSSSAPSGKADSQATIVNPVYLQPLMGGFTAGALPASPLAWVDIGGMWILKPGAWIALGALTAVTGFGGLAWTEYDI